MKFKYDLQDKVWVFIPHERPFLAYGRIHERITIESDRRTDLEYNVYCEDGTMIRSIEDFVFSDATDALSYIFQNQTSIP